MKSLTKAIFFIKCNGDKGEHGRLDNLLLSEWHGLISKEECHTAINALCDGIEESKAAA